MKTRTLWNTAALTLALLSGTAAAIAQTAMPAKPTVYNNPQQPNDPRVGLKGGVTDAGVAADGMKLVLNLPKPPGFAAGTTPQEKGSRTAAGCAAAHHPGCTATSSARSAAWLH